MNEMAHRGFRMQPISLEKSQAFDFIIEGDTLIPPFISRASTIRLATFSPSPGTEINGGIKVSPSIIKSNA
jgi:hypothetical protein